MSEIKLQLMEQISRKIYFANDRKQEFDVILQEVKNKLGQKPYINRFDI